MHGGPTPAGPDSPNWKHGRFSKFKPDTLAEKAATAKADPELLNLTRVAADAQAVLDDYLEQLKNRAHLTKLQRDEVLKLQEHVAKQIERENRRRAELADTLTWAQAQAFAAQWLAIVLEVAQSDLAVPDRVALARARVHAIRPKGQPMVLEGTVVR